MEARILELPTELLEKILFHAALQRGIKRAMRLRLVCKKFSNATYPALFSTHLMSRDFYCYGDGTQEWHARNQHGSKQIWHEYLTARVMTERDASFGRYIEVRRIAEAICLERGFGNTAESIQSTVKDLCWLALRHRGKDSFENDEWSRWELTKTKCLKLNPNHDLNMLSAASYCGLLPLAKRLISEGHDPRCHNYLFAPPMQIAAETGNTIMLQFFQQQLQNPTATPRL